MREKVRVVGAAEDVDKAGKPKRHKAPAPSSKAAKDAAKDNPK